MNFIFYEIFLILFENAPAGRNLRTGFIYVTIFNNQCFYLLGDRDREREKEKDRDKNYKDREAEREKQKEREKKGLPAIKKENLSGEF